MKRTVRFFIFSLMAAFLIFFSSCSSTRRTTTRTPSQRPAKTGMEYIQQYKDLAIREMRRTNIPASITLAQGILESNYGRSTLARNANNHFGIKCHNTWSGPRIYHDDDRRNECFRKYNTAYESYKDHSEFLTTTSRYDFLFDYKTTDYKAWARGLKKAGYATSPTYARKLIELIERYKLYNYDSPEGRAIVATGSSASRNNLGNVDDFQISHPGHVIRTRNRVDYIIVKRGDTFQSLNRELDLLSWELPKYNELDENTSLEPGQILYLQPKRNKAAAGYDYHIVKEEDTMHSVSQLYGIKLEKLFEKNNMKKGEQPETGQKLWLRSQKPEK